MDASEADKPILDLEPYPISATSKDNAAVPAARKAFPSSKVRADSSAAAIVTDASVASIMRNVPWVR